MFLLENNKNSLNHYYYYYYYYCYRASNNSLHDLQDCNVLLVLMEHQPISVLRPTCTRKERFLHLLLVAQFSSWTT